MLDDRFCGSTLIRHWLRVMIRPITSRHASHLEVVSRASDESCLSYEICNRVGTELNENPTTQRSERVGRGIRVSRERRSTLSKCLIKFYKNNPWIDRKVSSRQVSLEFLYFLKIVLCVRRALIFRFRSLSIHVVDFKRRIMEESKRRVYICIYATALIVCNGATF